MNYSVRVSTVIQVTDKNESGGAMRWRVELYEGEELQASVTDPDLGCAFAQAYLIALHIKAEES